MSFSKVYSAQASLTRASIISIETDLSRGLHSFSIVGLPDQSIEESKDRVAAAIKNSGYISPKSKNQKVVISLAPADLRKEGPLFDVPMALAYLLASDDIRFDPEKKLFLGELSLDGTIKGIRGVLPLIKEARAQGFAEAYVPVENVREAALISGISIFGISHLQELISHINEKRGKDDVERLLLQPQPATDIVRTEQKYEIDFADIYGQDTAKRALEIAAAGGHNIAMYGPPGTGKTMLAKAFRHLLPPLSFEDMLEVTSIHSVAGLLKDPVMTEPPFRAPHHTSSYISIVGGGSIPKPGEVTLAHKGVLFMDEFAEFDRNVIDAMRQPLEDRIVTISRSKGTATFPAHVILIVAMNPCPCGNLGNREKDCICTTHAIARYQRKISGPIIDRIDIWTEVTTINRKILSESTFYSEKTDSMKARVQHARDIQSARFSGHERAIKTNSEMSARDIGTHARLSTEAKQIINSASEQLHFSGRTHHRVIKIAQTISDLAGTPVIDEKAMLEALQYRPKRIGG